MTKIKNLLSKLVIITAVILLLLGTYTQAEEVDDYLFKIRKNGKWGYMKKTGEILIPPAFDDVSIYVNGYMAVSMNGSWGIIDRYGNIVVPLDYSIEWKNGSSVMLVKNNQGLIALFYTKLGSLSTFIWRKVRFDTEESWFPVQRQDGSWEYVNEIGEELTEYSFYNADCFHEGWAGIELVEVKDRWYTYDALINQDGELLYAPEGYTIQSWDGVSEGLIQIRDDHTGLIGYMDMQGSIAITPVWDNAHAFHGNFAVVEDFSMGKSLFIDKQGRIIDLAITAPAEGDDSNNTFSNNCITVFMDNGSEVKLAVMDGDGIVLFVNQNSDIMWIFHYDDSSMAWYMNKDRFYGRIDKSGKLITPAVFGCNDENGSQFTEGVAPVSQDCIWGFIDFKGKWVLKPQWEKAWPFDHGLALVKANDSLAYVDHYGNILWSEVDWQRRQENAN